MQEAETIKTPFKVQWRRIRYQMMPVLVMGASMIVAAWLWNRHAGASMSLGEVDTTQRVVMAPASGLLISMQGDDDSKLQMFEPIEKDAVIARLDSSTTRRQLQIMELELERMKLEVGAKQEQLRADAESRRDDRATEARRLANKVDTLRLAILDYRNKIEMDKLELKTREAEFALIEPGDKNNTQRLEATHRIDAIKQQITSGQAALSEAEDQLKAALKRTEAHSSTPEMVDADKQLAPLRQAIAEQEKKMEDLKQQIEGLEIRSPFRGRIVAIHRYPGQLVHEGDPLLTLAKDQSSHIKCFVRQEQRINPTQNMKVEIRRRVPGAKPAESFIVRVGPQLEKVPDHLLHQNKVQEWGIPVHIAMPQGMDLRPGELVDLKFIPEKQS